MVCQGYRYSFNSECSCFEFNENSVVIYSEEDIRETEYSFWAWEEVNCEISEIGNYEYINFIIEGISESHYYYNSRDAYKFFLKRDDAKKVIEFYEKRNVQINKEKQRISSYIDDYVLDIANNLVNIVDMSLFYNMKVLLYCSKKYCYSEHVNYYNLPILATERKANGDFTKAAEKYNTKIRSEIKKIDPFLKNMTEIISKEKKVKDYIARAIVWEAVQRKMLDYFSEKWQEEYELKLETDYDELLKQMPNRSVEAVQEEYAKIVFLCDEFDSTNIWTLLSYFLISKTDITGKLIYGLFYEYDKKLEGIKEKLSDDAIKKKLITKQKRKISKYTITDVDLMNGSEFEEFVGVLFKKMGYASKVTQKSGDQGIDVIATRNGTKIGIQVKCYSNSVGNSAVQEAIAGKNFYKCDKALVVTNNYFTPAAIELAQTSDIILWNRDLLKEKIAEFMGE